MAEPQWEPSAEQVEELHARWRGMGYEDIKRDCLRRQHEREAGLLDAMDEARDAFLSDGEGFRAQQILKHALAAHAKLDAPKVPTLHVAAREMVEALEAGHWTDPTAGLIATKALALKAAVEREDAK